jgi:hypothetical protein
VAKHVNDVDPQPDEITQAVLSSGLLIIRRGLWRLVQAVKRY